MFHLSFFNRLLTNAKVEDQYHFDNQTSGKNKQCSQTLNLCKGRGKQELCLPTFPSMRYGITGWPLESIQRLTRLLIAARFWRRPLLCNPSMRRCACVSFMSPSCKLPLCLSMTGMQEKCEQTGIECCPINWLLCQILEGLRHRHFYVSGTNLYWSYF